MRLWSAKRSSASPSAELDARSGPGGALSGLRYDPRAGRGHIESWFLKANDPRSHRAIWLKWTLWAGDRDPSRAVAEVWAVAFGAPRGHVATKTTVPFDQARFEPDRLAARVDGCTLTPEGARGRVESGGRSIEYELSLAAPEPPYAMYPAEWMYSGPVPAQKTVTPIPGARVSGRVAVAGELWELDAWPGMVGHNWGRHTESYVWGHCNLWDDEDDVILEGTAGRVRAGGVLLPLRTGVIVRHHGTTYRMSSLRSVARNTSSLTARRWQFHAAGPRAELTGEMWADTSDLVGLFYPNPDGVTIHCLNSKVAHAEVTLRLSGRAPRTLRSTRAALEIGTLDPHHGVRMYV